MGYIDRKQTIWVREYFNDSNYKKIIENNIKQNKDPMEGVEINDYEYLISSSEELTPEENNNQPTIEVYIENQLIYDNCTKNV